MSKRKEISVRIIVAGWDHDNLDRLQRLENATKMIEICEEIEEYMAEAFLKLNTMKEHVKHEREHYEKHH